MLSCYRSAMLQQHISILTHYIIFHLKSVKCNFSHNMSKGTHNSFLKRTILKVSFTFIFTNIIYNFKVRRTWSVFIQTIKNLLITCKKHKEINHWSTKFFAMYWKMIARFRRFCSQYDPDTSLRNFCYFCLQELTRFLVLTVLFWSLDGKKDHYKYSYSTEMANICWYKKVQADMQEAQAQKNG